MKSWQSRWQQQPDEELEYHPKEPPPDQLRPFAPLYVHETAQPPCPCAWCQAHPEETHE